MAPIEGEGSYLFVIKDSNGFCHSRNYGYSSKLTLRAETTKKLLPAWLDQSGSSGVRA
ncbi:hypothetical protein [Paenibacillus periandrae]|uniref:hypothetical protein n=1 Tax=Paenibacillus periandrae TaxID=1761741 RepID=UPI001F09AA41|nr:hypothetical protein [Paenibacillus periandrae]